MKYRILECADGRFIIERKRWWGWQRRCQSRVIEWYYFWASLPTRSHKRPARFTTFEKANRHLNQYLTNLERNKKGKKVVKRHEFDR